MKTGLSDNDVSEKYGVPKNTAYLWLKKKEKIFVRSGKGEDNLVKKKDAPRRKS